MEVQQKFISVKEVLKSAWGLYQSRFRDVLLIGLIPALCFVIGALLGSSPALHVVTFLLYLCGIIFYIFYGAAIIFALEKGTDVRESYRLAVKNFLSYAWVSILTQLVILGGLVMAVMPAIIFSVWFFLSPILFVAEGRKGMDALLASKAYARGYFWQLLGRNILIGLLVGLFAWIVSMLFGWSGKEGGGAISALIQLFSLPFIFSYGVVMYRTLRTMKPEIETIKEKKGFFIFSALMGLLAPLLLIFGGLAAFFLAFFSGKS